MAAETKWLFTMIVIATQANTFKGSKVILGHFDTFTLFSSSLLLCGWMSVNILKDVNM